MGDGWDVALGGGWHLHLFPPALLVGSILMAIAAVVVTRTRKQ
jgi:hypothetical protein